MLLHLRRAPPGHGAPRARAQLWRDAGALSAKQASKIKASKLGEEKKFFGLF